MLRVFVTAANVTEREGGIQVLQRVKQTGRTVWRLHTIWVDGGFRGDNFFQLVMDVCHWIVQVVLRPKEHPGLWYPRMVVLICRDLILLLPIAYHPKHDRL